jgi:hypothetical protein
MPCVRFSWVLVPAMVAATGCGGGEELTPDDVLDEARDDGGPGPDADADVDTDGPAEADADADADAETDGGPEAGRLRVAAGTRHTCAVLGGGDVKCWGSGTNGALGYGNENDIGASDTPADHGAVQLGGPAVAVAAGFGISCALLEGGDVSCWGATTALGYGSSEHVGDDEDPVDFGTIDVGGTVERVSAGAFHICVLLTTGELKCWGSNGRGQLGLGHTDAIGDDELPSSIEPLDLGSRVVDFGTGFDYTCALLESGEVRCWGFGEAGRLGQGNLEEIGDDELPTDVPPVDVGPGTVTDITVGAGHACVLFNDGGITCWGIGVWGALGYASTANVGDDEVPADAGRVNLGGTATAVWAAAHNTCARLDDRTIKCWGLGDLGANGYASTAMLGDDETPARLGPVDVGVELLDLTEGDAEHWCGTADGGLRCWGPNNWGQLGLGRSGTIGDDETPADAGFVPLD